jgi:ABC-type dipeptide/oligopeptide/nickel transport system ATPase component
VPLLREEPGHCVFSPRCAYAEPRCLTAQPALRQISAGAAHQAACVLDRIPDPARETAPRAQAT